MRRVCFELRVHEHLLEEYLERHRAVWPEMLREIAASGRRDYSLFHAGGGRLIGYFETDDLDASQRYLSASSVAARWEAEMSRFLDTGGERADQSLTPLPSVFSLEAQLADHGDEPQHGDAPRSQH